MYRAEILADSLHPSGSRLTTFLIEFPRVVLAEVVTHRLNSDTWDACAERTTTPDVSKNSASSRAVPHERFRAKILNDPYLPAFTGKQKGMQGDYLSGDQSSAAAHYWLGARDAMVEFATALNGVGVHKQDSNRLLEPWAWVTQVVTSARWDNFFALRCHEAAHPAFRRVARMMFLARRKSEARRLRVGQWHAPFLLDAPPVWWRPRSCPFTEMPTELLASAARCAWVSYENHDKDTSAAAVLSTVARLVGSRPVHASPFEHQATPAADANQDSNLGPEWVQLRKLLPDERCDRFEPTDEEIAAWPESAQEDRP